MVKFSLRPMVKSDYEKVYELWMTIHGFAIRSIDDSKEGVWSFLDRNPSTSVVAIDAKGDIVGAILCGHDGRRGCLYHVCVREDMRRYGIGKAMVNWCMEALKKEGVNKANLIAFKKNAIGNAFWKMMGWLMRDDVNYYELVLNENNITEFNP